MKMVFNDLFVDDCERTRHGIYWVRIFARRARHVVVVTEVPCNPGWSVYNKVESVAARVKEVLLPGRKVQDWFLSYISESGEPEGDYCRVTFSGRDFSDARFERGIEKNVVEKTIGSALPALPAFEELDARVLAAGGIEDEDPRPYSAFPLGDLPAPHFLARCRFEPKSAKVLADLGENGAGRHFWPRFFETVGAELGACPYHAADGQAIAGESIRIITELGPVPEPEPLQQAIQEAPLTEPDRMWLWSLFTHPLVVHGGGFTNGQHRGCALRASGATEVVVRE